SVISVIDSTSGRDSTPFAATGCVRSTSCVQLIGCAHTMASTSTRGAFDDDFDPGSALLHDPRTPFSDDDRVLIVQVEIFEFSGICEPICVHVNQGWPVNERGMGARKHEGRAGDGAAHAQALTYAATERGLSSTEWTRQNYQ